MAWGSMIAFMNLMLWVLRNVGVDEKSTEARYLGCTTTPGGFCYYVLSFISSHSEKLINE
jgi:hypothetical protein